MKSIKEKAIEIYPALEGDVSGTSENLVKRNGFQTGANYVLEEVEKVIKSDRILGHPFPSLEMRYNQIISIIEQLKK